MTLSAAVLPSQRLDATGRVAEHTDFTWDGPVLAEQATLTPDTSGELVTTWDYQPGTFTPLTQAVQPGRAGRATSDPAAKDQVDSQFYAIITDLIGTPSELVTPNGDLAGYQQHTLWGTTLWHPEGASTPLRFPGQYADDETGLHYNHHRYYDPVTGRYLTPDPLGLTPAPNPHAYVPNPMLLADPLGLAPYKLSDKNPVSGFKGARAVRDEYEKLQQMRAAQRLGVPYTGERPTPNIDPVSGLQKVFQGNELGPLNAAKWRGALEWLVPGTSHRLLEIAPDITGGIEKIGYVVRHNYGSPKLFPGPWYKEGG
jgi:RHS repeat-associated protein